MTTLPKTLLVDDDYDFCEGVSSYLEDKGIAIAIATDPQLVVNADLKEVTAIFLDIDMPRLSGMDVLESIRQKNETVTIVMVSCHNDIDTRLSCLERGADFFLAKPVDLEEMYLILRRLLDIKPAVLPNEQPPEWTLSRSRFALVSPTGGMIGLSASEFRVFEMLLQQAPEAVGKDELAIAATGKVDRQQVYTRALEVLISRVRTRASNTNIKLPVKAVRNLGYVFHGNCRVTD